jgi:energy-converting hydrogenase Eha subunit C
MLLAGILYFALVFSATILWGSIYVVERNNPYNKYAMALLLSAGNIVLSFSARIMPGGDMIYLIGALVLLLRLLMLFYQLDILRALIAAGLTIGAPYVIGPVLGDWVGNSFTRLYLLFYGLPTAILATWIVLRVRKPNVEGDSPIPRARVEKLDRKKKAEAAPTAVPAKPSVPVVAPPPQPAQRPDGEPTLLT